MKYNIHNIWYVNQKKHVGFGEESASKGFEVHGKPGELQNPLYIEGLEGYFRVG
jgi:hypothetical protein